MHRRIQRNFPVDQVRVKGTYTISGNSRAREKETLEDANVHVYMCTAFYVSTVEANFKNEILMSANLF